MGWLGGGCCQTQQAAEGSPLQWDHNNQFFSALVSNAVWMNDSLEEKVFVPVALARIVSPWYTCDYRKMHTHTSTFNWFSSLKRRCWHLFVLRYSAAEYLWAGVTIPAQRPQFWFVRITATCRMVNLRFLCTSSAKTFKFLKYQMNSPQLLSF